jgi:hypothetical protein
VTEPFGPPPFRFQLPDDAPLRGPAFSLPFKLLLTVVVFGSAAWFARLWMAGAMPGFTWFLAALAMMLYTWWCVLRSVTRVDSRALYQSWIWDKEMELRELAYGKIVRVRGLDWLIAPRLYVRTLLGKFAVFYAADPKMLAEFERLVRELKAFRGFR